MACYKNRKKAQRRINRIARQIRKILKTDPLTAAYNPVFYQKKNWWIMPKYDGVNWPEVLRAEYILSIGGENLSIYINSFQSIDTFLHQIYNKLKRNNILNNYLSDKINSYFLVNEKKYWKRLFTHFNYIEEPLLEES